MVDHSLVRGLVRDWETVAEHEQKSDPHLQYALETDALDTFSFAAYGGMSYSGDSYPFQDIGEGWEHLDMFDALVVATPRHITVDLDADTLSTDGPGVFMLSLGLSIEHNSLPNSGRVVKIRLFDTVAQTPLGSGFAVGTGRNAEITVVALNAMFDVASGAANHALSVQIGGGDVYTSVVFTTASVSVYSVGEFRETLGRSVPEPTVYLLDSSGNALIDDESSILTE